MSSLEPIRCSVDKCRYDSDIATASGTVPVTVDQKDPTKGGGRWVSLGMYSFNAGTAGSVTVKNDAATAQGYVIADAVRFLKR